MYVTLWVYPDCMCNCNITFRTESLYFLAQLFPTRLNLGQRWLKVMLAMVLPVSQISHYLKTLSPHLCQYSSDTNTHIFPLPIITAGVSARMHRT